MLRLDSAQAALNALIDQFTPDLRVRAKTALRKLRQYLPGATEFVYDNYNALVIGFGPTDTPSEAVLSLVLYPRQLILCFLWGAELFDPDKVLRGSGARARTIVLDDPARLDHPKVAALVHQAASRAIWRDAPSHIIFKSTSARKRPRVPA